MLLIKDLAAAKELDTQEMAAVRGGNKIEISNVDNSGYFTIGNGNLSILGDKNVVGDGNTVTNDSYNGNSYYGHSHHKKWC